jgi:CxxC-x17-CxxC domain-containing protein
MPYTDRTLTCVECGTEFIFSAEDQEYHDSRGFSDPRRCPSCRQARRDTVGGGSRPMGNRSGGGGGYSSGGGGGYSSAPRQMYPAVCAECGQQTEVPFEPRTDRPVYCRTCFARRQGSAPRGGGRY